MYVSLDTVRANQGDEFGRILTLNEAARTVDVTPRTIRRWIKDGNLATLPGGRHVLERHVRECERDRHLASRRGRPGARVSAPA